MARSYIREEQMLDADVLTEAEHAALDHTGIPGCSGTTFSGSGYSGSFYTVTEISENTYSKTLSTFENGLLTDFSGVSGGTVSSSTYKNLIINGNFAVSQRGSSWTAPIANQYTVDRWKNAFAGSMVFDITVSASDLPSNQGAANAYIMQITTAQATIGVNDYLLICQIIEGVNFKYIQGKTGVLSFWIKAYKAGTYAIALRNATIDATYVTEFTVYSSATWEKKTIVITFNGGSIGTWNYTNGTGVEVFFVLACGSNRYTSTADQWNNENKLGTSNVVNGADSTSNYFKLAQVQLEVGSVATPYEFTVYSDELKKCKRYYQNSFINGDGYGWRYGLASQVHHVGGASFETYMRAIPTTWIASAPTYQNCAHFDVVPRAGNFEHRVTVTANGIYRAYAGLYAFDAEL